MDYQDARARIQTGDLIAVRGGPGIINDMTRYFTDDPHTHTGIALWVGEHLFMADLNSGRNHLTLVDQVAAFDVYDPPPGLDRDAIEAAIYRWLATPIEYGIPAFIVIGIKCKLGITAFIHWRRVIVCSGGSVTVYEGAAAWMRAWGRMPPPAWVEHTRMLSPGELAAELPFKLAVGYESVPDGAWQHSN